MIKQELAGFQSFGFRNNIFLWIQVGSLSPTPNLGDQACELMFSQRQGDQTYYRI
jgi:hypothetical protein